MTRRYRQAGDTLIEVVLSIAILSVVLVSAFNVSSLSFRVGAQARERTEAINLAQKEAERLIATRDSLVQQFPDPAVTPSILNSIYFPVSTTYTQGQYQVSVTSSYSPRTDSGRTTQMVSSRVRVEWASIVPGPVNTLNLQVNLADMRGIEVRDCPVKGEDLNRCFN